MTPFSGNFAHFRWFFAFYVTFLEDSHHQEPVKQQTKEGSCLRVSDFDHFGNFLSFPPILVILSDFLEVGHICGIVDYF